MRGKGGGCPGLALQERGLSLVAGCRKGNGAAVMENERVRGSCSVKERGE